jgi:hypothetical protein
MMIAPKPAAFQGITRIVINESLSEPVTFGGTSFGAVGPYQKIRGIAYGQLDPSDPKNAVIADIALAQKDASGLVQYSMDFYILKPVDLAKGNHKVFYEVNNRGGKQFGGFNQSSGGNNPTTATDAGSAFLMNQGYTLAWAGWDGSATNPNPDILHINLPLAKTPDGSSITGPSYEYIVADNATTKSFQTYYITTTMDPTKASLTMRRYLTDPPTPIASNGWSWTTPNTIALANGAAFQQSWIYELTYTAQDPYVAGIGLAATRDFASFLRNAAADQMGTPNPLAGDVKRVVSWSLSQPARLMNDFIWLGFNQDTSGRKVFDGVFNWIGGGNGLGINYRFAQNGRTERNRQNHLNAEATFPFAFATTTDPLTGKTDGRLVRCTASGTCPLIMNIFSGNELWVKAGSLAYTDPATGKDIPEPPNVRSYYVAGAQHGGASAPNTVQGATSFGSCSQFGSGVEPNPLLRALWVDLDEWLDGTLPPPSEVPSLDKGTAVLAQTGAYSALGIGVVPQSSLGYPTIPNAPASRRESWIRTRASPPESTIRPPFPRSTAMAMTSPGSACPRSSCRSRPTPAGACARPRSAVSPTAPTAASRPASPSCSRRPRRPVMPSAIPARLWMSGMGITRASSPHGPRRRPRCRRGGSFCPRTRRPTAPTRRRRSPS